MVKNLEQRRRTILKSTKKIAKEANVIKTVEDMRLELAAKQKDLIDAKRGHKQGELVNPCILRSTRKQIARLHTAIRAASTASLKEEK